MRRCSNVSTTVNDETLNETKHLIVSFGSLDLNAKVIGHRSVKILIIQNFGKLFFCAVLFFTTKLLAE